MLGECALGATGGLIGFVFAWVTSWSVAYRARKPWWTIPALGSLWGGVGLAGPFAIVYFEGYIAGSTLIFCYLLGLAIGGIFFLLLFFLSERFRERAKPADRRREDRRTELQVTYVVLPSLDVKNARKIKMIHKSSQRGLFRKAAGIAEELIKESLSEKRD